MTNFFKTMKTFMIALLVIATAGSCQNEYPDLKDGLYAEIVTNKGKMVAELYYEKVPVVVANFVGLAEGTHPKLEGDLKGKPFYNGITFHRVMDKFMIQGGDPTATGTGSAGYKFMSEFDSTLSHDRAGILSMANSGGFATNGSQFFITEVVRTQLDAFNADGSLKNCNAPRTSCHSVFGLLVKGLDVQDSISNVKVLAGNKPEVDVVMESVNIIRIGASAKAFDAPTVFTEQEPTLAKKIEDINAKQAEIIKEKTKAAAQTFIKNNSNIKGELKEFPTGLIMIKTFESNGKTPTSDDTVLIDCTGYFEDGRFFYTTVEEKAKEFNQYNEQAAKQGAYKPFPMPYNDSASLVPGFRQAMLNMNVGDKAKIFVPSYLGYGAAGRGPIGPNTNIVFDIEIKNIK